MGRGTTKKKKVSKTKTVKSSIVTKKKTDPVTKTDRRKIATRCYAGTIGLVDIKTKEKAMKMQEDAQKPNKKTPTNKKAAPAHNCKGGNMANKKTKAETKTAPTDKLKRSNRIKVEPGKTPKCE